MLATRTVTDFVEFDSMPTLTAFTVCLWMKTSDSKTFLTLFSYATPQKSNALLIILRNAEVKFEINDIEFR